jgi:hypothetical protein
MKPEKCVSKLKKIKHIKRGKVERTRQKLYENITHKTEIMLIQQKKRIESTFT